MMSCARLALCSVLTLCLCACNSSEEETAPAPKDFLDELYLNYFYADEGNGLKAVESLEELRSYLRPEELARIESGEVVVRWGVRFAEHRPILAYYRDVPTSGGLVIYAEPLDFFPETRTEFLTAEEFQAKIEADDAAAEAEEERRNARRQRDPAPESGGDAGDPQSGSPLPTEDVNDSISRDRSQLLQPEWLAGYVRSIGVDAVIAAFPEDLSEEEQLVRQALSMSLHVLRDHPERTRNQLQARLVIHADNPLLAPFQKLPADQGLQLRSLWPSYPQAGGPLVRIIDDPGIIELTPDGSAGYANHDDRQHRVDLTTGEMTPVLQAAAEVFSTDGSTALYVDNQSGTFTVSDMAQGQMRYEFQGAEYQSNSAITPDGRIAATAPYGKEILIWDLESGELLHTLGHSSDVEDFAFVSNGETLVSASRDDIVRFWNVGTGDVTNTIDGQQEDLGPLQSLAVSPDGLRVFVSWAATRDGPGVIRIYDAANAREIAQLNRREGHGRIEDEQMCISQDNQRVVARLSPGDIIEVWNVPEAILLAELRAPGEPMHIMLSAAGDTLVAKCHNNTLGIWDLQHPGITHANPANIGSISCTTTNQQFVLGNRNGTVSIGDALTGEVTQTVEGHDGCPTVIALNGSTLASGGDADFRPKLIIRDLESGETLGELEDPDMISADGSTSVALDYEEQLNIWDVGTSTLTHTVDTGEEMTMIETISKSGRRLVTWELGFRTIQVWDLESGEVAHQLNWEELGVPAGVAVGSDDETFVVGTVSGGLWLWIPGRNLLEPFPDSRDYDIEIVAISPDGRMVVSTEIYTEDRVLQIWDLETRQCLYTDEVDDGIMDVQFDSTSTRLLVRDWPGRAHLFAIEGLQ